MSGWTIMRKLLLEILALATGKCSTWSAEARLEMVANVTKKALTLCVK